MLEVIADLRRALDRNSPVAYCRLVETRGSTPQKAGALMLVYPDGRQSGTLGGGCVEAEVKRRALAVLASSRAEIAAFQLDQDYGWDDGLICGGRMQVLIEPLDERAAPYFRALAALADGGGGGTEVIVFDGQKSGLVAPISYLFSDADQPVATLRADIDSVPQSIFDQLRPLHERPVPHAHQGISFLPLLPRCRLLIVGGGHVGKAVGDLAVDLDFDVWVIDDRDEFVSESRFPRAQRRIAGDIPRILREIEITADTYCLIVTRGHNHDEKALFYLADRGARYVGLIGSRRKLRMIFDDLLAEGVSRHALEQVYAPVGVDIGSQTVPEIAVSIAAELIAHRNLGGRVPGRPTPVSQQR